LLTTHIQADQIAEIPDEAKRELLEGVNAEQVNTASMAWDISRWGRADWTSDVDVELIKFITSGTRPSSAKHMKDALIALTALRKADVLVTEDKRLLNQLARVLAPNALKVWNFAEFAAWIKAQG
jgi:hypothetical protein